MALYMTCRTLCSCWPIPAVEMMCIISELCIMQYVCTCGVQGC